ncbi:hypothetical protein ACQX0N_01510 [Clostridium tepidum]|uniref:Uncharacterized protein n=2 Tax=Clostridium TaxID=1485 RepID=A0A1S9IBC2_9CLOT|nr:hypothetical protein [Clostridium tepidum]MCR1933405.1 hypothetical protein [Clostridium tepidum]OOO61505.1 hypothetical protein BS637_12050 [Clostridium tepidum]OOO67620.1 hypothetical protein BS638_05330 [Clostridium tepidum]
MKGKMNMYDIKENANTKVEKVKEKGKKNIKLNEEKSKKLLKENTKIKEEHKHNFTENNDSKDKKVKLDLKENSQLEKKENKKYLKEDIKVKTEKEKNNESLKEKIELKKNNEENNTIKMNEETRKKVLSKVPIVIANFEVEMIDSIFTKIDSTFIDIKEIKNNVFIESANLIKLNFNKAKLFIKGYIRSYIEYITLDNISKSAIITKNQGIISHKDFSKAINIDLLFFDNMKKGESFLVDFNNYTKDKDILLGEIKKIDIKSSNIYKNTENYPFEREKCYLVLQQDLLIRANISILQNNVVIL